MNLGVLVESVDPLDEIIGAGWTEETGAVESIDLADEDQIVFRVELTVVRPTVFTKADEYFTSGNEAGGFGNDPVAVVKGSKRFLGSGSFGGFSF